MKYAARAGMERSLATVKSDAQGGASLHSFGAAPRPSRGTQWFAQVLHRSFNRGASGDV